MRAPFEHLKRSSFDEIEVLLGGDVGRDAVTPLLPMALMPHLHVGLHSLAVRVVPAHRVVGQLLDDFA
jgi:hypothetical protein